MKSPSHVREAIKESPRIRCDLNLRNGKITFTTPMLRSSKLRPVRHKVHKVGVSWGMTSERPRTVRHVRATTSEHLTQELSSDVTNGDKGVSLSSPLGDVAED